GDNAILKKMNRPYKISDYKKIIKKVRAKMPDIAISTDIIVGFPGETEKQFKNTEKIFKEIEYNMAYISEYSPRSGTAAFKFKDDVSSREKARRRKILENLLIKSALKKNKNLLNKKTKVLIYEQNRTELIGKSEHYKTVKIVLPEKTKENFVGKFIDAKILKVFPWGLKGELINNKLVVILGTTAAGKTDLAIKLAKDFNGEIVSADSRQIYKELDIGTAKPKYRKNKKQEILIGNIVHHFIDFIDLKKDFNVALYKKLAIEKIKEIQEKGKIPFLVGGTGLYISAIVDNLEFPKIIPDKKLRKKLEKKSVKELFKMYKKLDPQGAKTIEKGNKRRLVRAIEVSMLSDSVFSQIKSKGTPIFDILEIGIDIDKYKLRKAIYKRVVQMFESGLEKEVRKLAKKYGWENVNLQTIGYQEWKDYFDGKISKEELQQIIKNHTWQYARRQITWFKRDERINWIKNYSEAQKLFKNFL
ncbi:MAG: tRNA (adenosine(37)-N6)-dimethylallyltransferase MiaA, partial [bacterium]|nr:tRNA (adenosine(37)-N6)-dimethylallyltransferase MiaA [bacterium]